MVVSKTPVSLNIRTDCILFPELMLPGENKNLKKIKPSADHQGPLFDPSKSFAAHQNLVRLSL